MRGFIQGRLRPIRLAFVVPHNNQRLLSEVIGICSLYWGGMYFPIIPYSPAMRSSSCEQYGAKNASDILNGYLENFDPDFIVAPKAMKLAETLGGRKVIQLDKLLFNEKWGGADEFHYGLGIFHILNNLFEEEFKFEKKFPERFILPKKSQDLFMQAYTGFYPKKYETVIRRGYTEAFDIKIEDVNRDNYLTFYPDSFFPRHLTTRKIEVLGRERARVFYFDPDSFVDIVNYINLRAYGYKVLPIIKGTNHSDKIISEVWDFLDEEYYPINANNVYNHASLIKSNSVSEEDFKAFLAKVDIKRKAKTKKKEQPFYIDRLPNFVTTQGRFNWRSNYFPLESRQDRFDIRTEDSEFSFKALQPLLLNKPFMPNGIAYANEIYPHLWGKEEPLAEVFPRDMSTWLRRGPFRNSFDSWRTSQAGLVAFQGYLEDIDYEPLKAEEVIVEFLRSNGWESNLSSAGKLTKQIYKRVFETNAGLQILSSEGLLKILAELNNGKSDEGKAISSNELGGRLSKLVSSLWMPKDATRYLRRLIDVGMFRLGVQLQCPVCIRNTWHNIFELDSKIRCPKCLGEYELPVQNTRLLKWSYTTYGPFTSPNLADGAYSVLLTLNALEGHRDNSLTPAFSLNIKHKTHGTFEVDMCLFHSSSKFEPFRKNAKVSFVLCECKSWGNFEPIDIRRMKNLSKQFPGAVLLFSTFRKSLTSKEIKTFKAWVAAERMKKAKGKSYSEIIILTGNELFDLYMGSIRSTWEKIGGKHKELSQVYYDEDGELSRLADDTQQLYLGFDSYQKWYFEEYKKKKP